MRFNIAGEYLVSWLEQGDPLEVARTRGLEVWMAAVFALSLVLVAARTVAPFSCGVSLSCVPRVCRTKRLDEQG